MSGQYQLACACALQAAGFAVVVINPRQARDFAKAMGRLVKTDSVDARVLAELAQVLNLRPDRDRFIKPMPDQAQQYLYALVLRRRQLVRLLVSERQARGKRIICGGRATVRSALYMAAIVAMRHNAVIRRCYERLLAAGKPKKVAIVACMRKLLIIMNAMVKSGRPWSDQLAQA
ncbi:putative transposase [Bordetella petrii]|uniref:Transposase n=1 Tax=Bordetella petrii (strain ATCC BAA-461 / DSM 12804 / CCUG 43448 / CIP 107267 / Se-1111R) TaxID=340100 RepID=A9I9C6_BORPD|nr:transposase [Bordetella petrii]CAP41353.1 putative transposase [Bordetella petrii]